MANILDLFKALIIVQAFYAFAILLIAHSLPAPAYIQASDFIDLGQSIDLENIATGVEGSLESQTNIPVIELGALVFYSGNLLIDFLLNFLYATPAMFTLLLRGLLFLINADTFIWAYLQLIGTVVVSALYFIGVLQLLVGIRSGRLT